MSVSGTTTFALNPAKAVTGLYDFTTSEHNKIYKAATTPLKVVHNGTSKTLCPMLEELKSHAKQYKWDQTILKVKNQGGTEHDLIDHSRMLTMDEIKTEAIVYMDKPTREAQDNKMLQQCILDSLSIEGQAHLIRSRYQYKINDEVSATMLIKLLIQMCEVETYFTSFMV